MTTIFCNPNSFTIVDALPELVTFNAAHFIDHVIVHAGFLRPCVIG
jgi:hypothetical protein